MKMTGQKAAEILFNCATILEMHGANEYRIGAYRNAARIMVQLGDDAANVVADAALLTRAGFGASLARKLRELFTSGNMGFYEGLLASLPDEVARLMKMPGVGPKLAVRLHAELGVRSLRQLALAAGEGRVSKLRGFGPKREARWAAYDAPGHAANVTPLRPLQPVLLPVSDGELREAA